MPLSSSPAPLQFLAERYRQDINLSLEHRFPWGESLGSKVDQTLLTPCCLIMVYILSCFALSSTAHLSSGTPVHELISGLLCNNCTTDMMLHFVPILLKYDSHFHLGSVRLQPQEKYLIPSSAHPPARDFNLRVSKSCAKA